MAFQMENQISLGIVLLELHQIKRTYWHPACHSHLFSINQEVT
ncbi:Uncharacterised protein [Legionella jordanis]|nr:Uncharacterised protein [Legionella jordanis]